MIKFIHKYFQQILISFACLDPKYLHLNAHIEVKKDSYLMVLIIYKLQILLLFRWIF